MKKAGYAVLCILFCLTLAACGSNPAAESPEQSPSAAVQTPAPSPSGAPEPTPEPPQMSLLTEENAPARAAYGAALKELRIAIFCPTEPIIPTAISGVSRIEREWRKTSLPSGTWTQTEGKN